MSRYNPAPPCGRNTNIYFFSQLSTDSLISHSIGETSDEIRAILSPLLRQRNSLYKSQQELSSGLSGCHPHHHRPLYQHRPGGAHHHHHHQAD